MKPNKSVPNFDSPIELEWFVKNGVANYADEFTVTGPLPAEKDDDDSRENYDWQVLVSIWQTEGDIQTGGSPERVVARALGVGGIGTKVKSPPGKWSARMVMRREAGEASLTPDHPATGLAHFVENEGDPTQFRTYLWIERLYIKKFTPNEESET